MGETNGTDGTVARMEGGSPKLGWIDYVENNFRNFGFRDRKHATSNLEHWRRITGESRVSLWLLDNNRSKVLHISHTVHYNLITVI
jgi:hypothetical protein